MNVRPLAALLGGLLIAGCIDDDASIIRPPGQRFGGRLLSRYVALGNSTTAGFQSGGINDSLQMLAYPSLIAGAANVPFNAPLLNRPGCPPPLAAPLSSVTIGGTPLGEGCSLRQTPLPRLVNNLATPGATIRDAVDLLADPDPSSTFNRLQLFFLGGRSQLNALKDADPTFVTVALGDNDALGAVLSGDVAQLTPLADFEASLNAIADSINATDARDAIFLGVFDVSTLPVLQPGLFYWAVGQNPATAPLLPKPVSNDCAPVTGTGAPNPNAANQIPFTIFFTAVDSVRCSPGAPLVLTAAERAAITQRVNEYNGAIAAVAAANGWSYFDRNALFGPALSDPAQVRKCQTLLTAQTPAQIAAAVATTCPSPDPSVGFGSLFSFDGIHPSSAAQRLIADGLISIINQKHGLEIPGL